MKLKKWMLFSLILMIPFLVYAEDEEMEKVAETKKYFKTITILSGSNVTRNSDLGEVTSITTEITEEEYNNADIEQNETQNNQRGITSETIETNYKLLTTTMYKRNDYYFHYKTTLTWKTIPATRSYDIIGIGFLNTIIPEEYPTFVETYCRSSSECYETTSYYLYNGSNGVGVMFKVPTGTLTKLEQVLEFDVEKANSGTLIYQLAVGDYSHATSSISYDNAKKFTVDTSGINLNSSIEAYYDVITEAESEWTGTW